MQKLDLFKFYLLSAELAPIKDLEVGESLVSAMWKLGNPIGRMHSFLTATAAVPMPNARSAARDLLDHLVFLSAKGFEGITPREEDEDDTLTFDDHERAQSLLADFEKEFEHESRELNVFSVSGKGTHSTTKLLDSADLNLPNDVRSRLSAESLADIKAAGRCLGFDNSTAAGFHILRAVEPVIVTYVNLVTSSMIKKPKARDWGAYIKLLRTHGGDLRVVEVLQHIKDFYRNPIMHPEQSLTPDQALSLFHACLSVLVQLDAAILKVQGITSSSSPTTSTP
jgi:hypothetical protein